MSDTVTVTRRGKTPRPNAKYDLTFSMLTGQSFGPYPFTEAIDQLRFAAELPGLQARDLVLDAHTAGSATTAMGGAA